MIPGVDSAMRRLTPALNRVACRLIPALMLAGCATPPPRIVTVDRPVEVRIAVPTPCVREIPAMPDVSADAALVDLDDYRLVLTIYRDRLALRAHVEELRAVLAACSTLPRN